MGGTAVQALIEEGKEIGIQLGIEQGAFQGALRARQEDLLKFMRGKFKSVPVSKEEILTQGIPLLSQRVNPMFLERLDRTPALPPIRRSRW